MFPTSIRCSTISDDIRATADCLNSLGAHITRTDDLFHVIPIAEARKNAVIDCGESGSTLRFLLPVISALGTDTEIRMHGRLPERPLSPLQEELIRHGASIARLSQNTIRVSGKITGGEFRLAANVSSQFISGLLFALPLTAQPSDIILSGDPESASYVKMTLQAIDRFGIHWEEKSFGYSLRDKASYHSPQDITIVEGDWSNAAFWICADRVLGGTLSVSGLDPDSSQGDRAVERVSLRIAAGSAVVDCRDIPDLVPVLSVLAAVSPGQTKFINAGRLRIKESDRLSATFSLLTALGGVVEELEDGLIVTGRPGLRGGEVYSANDHRIAMSAAVASLACSEPVIIHDAEAVNKSYPEFWKDFSRLGGNVTLEEEA